MAERSSTRREPHVEYVVVDWEGRGILSHDPAPYLAELPRFRELLPPGAKAFACDIYHYDFGSVRCVKDLKFGHLRLVDDQRLTLEIRFEPNPWKHEGGLTIRYLGVLSVHAETDRVDAGWQLQGLRLDEILPHEHGCTHELAFIEGTIKVVCVDLEATWDA
jgi:hypothetical protein